MTTIIPEPSQVKKEPGQLVEMAWDPITRIVGSLGIYTKIDFENSEVVECHSTSSIFRGYSIFMKGKDPRDAHFITSRICGDVFEYLTKTLARRDFSGFLDVLVPWSASRRWASCSRVRRVRVYRA